jgi:hypothetical protein
LKYFKTGEKLTKSYIIQKMVGHEEYGLYVPNGIPPERLTREFLLAVSLFYIISLVDRLCPT